MEYLTNEKLLKQQPMFSLNNSRSNSVSRFLVPSQRNTHDPTQPMRSTDLFNRLDDILKSKQINTTTRKKSKQTSCIINPQTSKNDNSKEEYQRLLNNIENTNLKLPFEPTPFLNVYTDSKLQKHQNQIYLQQESCLRKKSSILYLQDTDNKKRENLKKFKQEFISMQEKIKSRNNSVVDFKVKDDSEKERISLKKLNQQLQEQNNNLQDQLLFEKGQNEKLNSLMNNLNDQVQMLNKYVILQFRQIGEQQLSSNQDSKEKDNLIVRLKQQLDQISTQHKKTLEQVKELTKQNIMFQEIQQGMHELENLCGAMENIGQHVTSHNQLVFELRDLFKIQNNIIDKIVNRKDFPIEQLIAPKKNFKNQQPLSEQVIETTTQLQQLKTQIKKQIDLLTERFIQDLLI